MTPTLYLASRSPRRRELLAQIGLTPHLVDVEVDETPRSDESAAVYVERLARAKAAAGAAGLGDGAVVLGADTAVVIDGAILGKPADVADAAAMLRRLAGRSHQVLTGVAVASGARCETAVAATEVEFAPLDEAAIRRYCATGEPLDKAGAYAIQGHAAVFVRRLAGSYSGVVGLPLFETASLLRSAGIEC